MWNRDQLQDRWPREVLDGYLDESIDIVKDVDEMISIGQLRYELFIHRDRKEYMHADHLGRVFVEPVDSVSLNFWHHENAMCLAAIRLTRATDALCDDHLRSVVLHAHLSDDEIARTVINSRMVVRDELRARLRLPALFRQIYRVGLISGARRCLVATRPTLVPLFERFGFVAMPRGYRDSVAGEMIVMMLDALDRDHLARVGSPYLKPHDELVPTLAGRGLEEFA